LEADFRQRYNQTVPADRETADAPLGGEVTRQKALLDELLATVPEAIVLLDTDDRILRVNPEFTRIFGYSEEEALGL
jgi:PAS domain-containing protein